MTDLQKFIIPETMTVMEALSAIDKAAKGIIMVCEGRKLFGVLTDGDIRRFILRNGDLNTPVSEVANRNFISLSVERSSIAREETERLKLRALPIIDRNGNLISICFGQYQIEDYCKNLNIPVVIMAGGKGTRLHPYTKVLPKPLIPIGDIPITMHIMQHFAEYGCKQFYMIVNHQKNLIKAYYSDVDIPFQVKYIDEEIPLGTGGGIKLLEGTIEGSFFLTNCDILIDANYTDIFNFHKDKQNIITMVCATKEVVIPYGTVSVNGNGYICKIKEKPSFSFLTNTGFYLLEPAIFKYIPENTHIHITNIIQILIDNGENVGMYPISDGQWSDMGQIDDMKKMITKYHGVDI